MKVCDYCRKEEVKENLKIKGKNYDLCDSCLNRIIKFLTTTEKSFTDKLGDIFK